MCPGPLLHFPLLPLLLLALLLLLLLALTLPLPLAVPQEEASPLLMQSNARMFTKGGLFCDEVGLGKTITTIALSLENGLSSTTAVELNPAKKIQVALDKCDADEGPVVKLRSRATLVICPSHLAAQWKQEAETHTNPPLKCHVISTILQLHAITWQDALESDFIIITVQFLRNKNYLMKTIGVKDRTA